jgi:hypothetical protein
MRNGAFTCIKAGVHEVAMSRCGVVIIVWNI